MKIHILFQFVEGPWGGGNQFLKALRREFVRTGIWCDDPAAADAVLFNSHHCLEELIRLKVSRPDLVTVHRVDGPMILTRGQGTRVDEAINAVNAVAADGTIFQTRWSRDRCVEHGMTLTPFTTTIINAPDASVFHPPPGRPALSGRRIRLIASSWSGNARKGFDVYEWLDRHLDFARYEMTFVGNSPVGFDHLRKLPPLASDALAEELRAHDIYIQASRNEPCSNALIEALHCGLPAAARDHAGNPEIVGDAGELFVEPEQVPALLDRISRDLDAYRRRIRLPRIDEVAAAYAAFVGSIVERRDRGTYQPKAPDAHSGASTLRVVRRTLSEKQSLPARTWKLAARAWSALRRRPTGQA